MSWTVKLIQRGQGADALFRFSGTAASGAVEFTHRVRLPANWTAADERAAADQASTALEARVSAGPGGSQRDAADRIRARLTVPPGVTPNNEPTP